MTRYHCDLFAFAGDGARVGLFEVGKRCDGGVWRFWIGGAFVEPECRGQGIGAALVKEARRIAVAKFRLREVFTDASPDSEGFWFSQGFVPAPPEKLHGVLVLNRCMVG